MRWKKKTNNRSEVNDKAKPFHSSISPFFPSFFVVVVKNVAIFYTALNEFVPFVSVWGRINGKWFATLNVQCAVSLPRPLNVCVSLFFFHFAEVPFSEYLQLLFIDVVASSFYIFFFPFPMCFSDVQKTHAAREREREQEKEKNTAGGYNNFSQY